MAHDDILELERFLPYRMARLAAEISRQMQAVYKAEFGLTIPEWRTLATIGQFGTTTATAIGSHASMHKTKVSRAVTALEQRRWVVRRQNPEDRREDYLSLTSTGRETYRHLVPRLRAFEAAILQRTADHGRDTDIAGLSSTLDALEQAMGLDQKPAKSFDVAPITGK